MHGLQQQYSDSIDFIHLDIDQSITRDVRFAYTLTGRSQYVLLDAEGNIIQKWFGFLNEADVAAFLTQYIESLTPTSA